MLMRVPKYRLPTHPGEMLLEEFLEPMSLTQSELADAIRVPSQQIDELVRGEREISPSTALRLAKFFGMSPDFWMTLQIRWDLFQAQQLEAEELEKIRPRTA